MSAPLKFHGWMRSGAAAGGVEGPDRSRLEGRLQLELTDLGNNPQLEGPLAAPFLLMGPGDVRGLLPGAVTAVMPPAADPRAEETKLAHVELAEADLPWRYSPRVATAGGTTSGGLNEPLPNGALKPWIVLVVGTPDEINVEGGGKVSLSATLTAKHDLSTSERWAHVQVDEEKTVARLLSPRDLVANTTYVAAVVPAFTADGNAAWQPGTAVRLDVYHWWTFTTGKEGDFATIAKKLSPPTTAEKPGLATLGVVPVTYDTDLEIEDLQARGALVRLGLPPTEQPAPENVRRHVAIRRRPLVDPRGRPILRFPNYGEAWALAKATQPADWREEMNADPRYRGSGGLGLWAGIAMQELIADAGKKQAAGLFVAAQRIRALTAGLRASGSLWERRLPTDPAQQLQVFGPSLARMSTDTSLVVNLVAGGFRPMPVALFSSAARRVFRPGTARARLVAADALRPDNLFRAANSCPAIDEGMRARLAHADHLDEDSTRALDEFLHEVAGAGPQRAGEVIEHLQPGAGRLDDVAEQTGRVQEEERARQQRGERPRPWRLFDDVDRDWARQTLDATVDDSSSLIPLATRPPSRRCVPVQDLTGFVRRLGDAIDPRSPNAIVRRRVLDTISGLDPAQPLAPPELCPDFDLPAWRFLRDFAQNWLLPGAGTLPKDRVIAVQTNRRFVDAFMVGLNTQALGELRWRNIPVRTDCTPLRRFWERINIVTNQPAYDIAGVHTWPADTPLGHVQHATGEAAKTNLVIVVHSELFSRYPDTLIYLMPRNANWTQPPDWTNPGARIFPTFPGMITPEIYFFGFDVAPSILQTHWLVLEEVPKGYRFASSLAFLQGEGRPEAQAEIDKRLVRFAHARDGGTFAAAALYDPVRVLISGESLDI